MHNATDAFKSTGNDLLDSMLCLRVPHSEDNWTVAAALTRALVTLSSDQVADVTGLPLLTVRVCLGNLGRASIARNVYQDEWLIVDDDATISA
jgi:hypothetical protein